jgi:hypothetical protein
MSSVSNFTPQTTMIDFLGGGKYRALNPDDMDGDGVVDGKSLSGDSGKVLNEGDVNALLAAHGLKAANGNFQSVDGFSVGSTNSNAATDFGGPPALPEVTGPTASGSSVGDRVSWLDVTQGLEDASLMWMALMTMAETSMRDIKDAKTIRNAMQKGKIEASKNRIDAAERKIEAERDAAVNQFVWSVVGAVVSFAAAWGASSIDNRAISAGVQGMSQNLGNVVTQYGATQSKLSGPQARADAEELKEKHWAMQEEIMDQAVDEAKSSYEESRELFKLALKIMSEHVERQSQVVQTVTRG